MIYLFECVLKVLRKGYSAMRPLQRSEIIKDSKKPEKVSDLIYNMLMSDKPCMIARYGAFELTTIVNYLSLKSNEHSIVKFIRGEQEQWWWNKKNLRFMQSNAGFFPSNPQSAERFCKLMLEDCKNVDMLGCWQKKEVLMEPYMEKHVCFDLALLEPYWYDRPWTRSLRNKDVLVIHPFAELILKQYEKRKKLFASEDILPDFKSIKTIKAVQSIGGLSGFKDWFDALDWMKMEMDKCKYDVVLIGCGAYGFPLAAYAKRTGHKAVHWGGSLQLYFGIKGNRWSSEKPYLDKYSRFINMKGLFNDAWVKPDETMKPLTADSVENACYW